MAKHLTDHRVSSKGGRVRQFLAIDRAQGDGMWRGSARRPVMAAGNRRLVEFLRIARGRNV